MTARILDGREIARTILDEARDRIGALAARGIARPTIAVARVGSDPASVRYAEQINRACRGTGLGFRLVVLDETIDDDNLIRALRGLNLDSAVNGILLQLPLPAHLSRERASESIDPRKDVDGVNPLSAGRVYLDVGRYFAPATPSGGIEILRRSGIEIQGRRAIVVGRSDIVGRPLAMLLLSRHATVTICHSRTQNLGRITAEADILAVAVGRARMITADMVKPGATVLDFGINVEDGAVVGDVDFAGVSSVAGAITPVPGGTGPVTNAVLLRHTIEAATWQSATA